MPMRRSLETKRGRLSATPFPLAWRRRLLRRFLRRIAEDGLGLEELVEGEVAPLAPVTAHLVATERGGQVAAAAVDRHLAGAQLRRHLAGLGQVRRLDVGGQAVLGVVA